MGLLTDCFTRANVYTDSAAGTIDGIADGLYLFFLLFQLQGTAGTVITARTAAQALFFINLRIGTAGLTEIEKLHWEDHLVP